MERLGRLIGVLVALSGFVAAHVLVQVGNAQVPPLPTVTVTTAVPVPTVTAPVPVPPTPTVTTPTVSVPAPPPSTPTVTVPTVTPPPTVAVPPAPTPPSAPKPAPPPAPAPSVPAVSSTAPVPVAPAVPTVTTPTVAASSTGAPPASGTSSPAPGSRSASGSSAGQASAGSGEAPAPGSSVVVIGAASSAAGSYSASRATPYGATTAAAGATAAAPRAVLGARKLQGKRVRTKSGVKVRLDFTLSRAARLFLIVRGPSPSCRIAGYIPIRGHKGKNTVLFAGRAQGRPLDPGVYLLSLSTTRSFTPGAPSEYVRVVSPRRAVPLPDSAARTPFCAEATAAPASFTTTWVSLVRAMPPTATTSETPGSKRPAAQIASAQNDNDSQDAAGLLPSPEGGALDGVTSSANEHPLAAIALLAMVAALLFAMVTLVTRFLRGSWNP